MGKWMISLVNSHTNATRIGWHLWEIDFRFAPGLPPGWTCPRARPFRERWPGPAGAPGGMRTRDGDTALVCTGPHWSARGHSTRSNTLVLDRVLCRVGCLDLWVSGTASPVPVLSGSKDLALSQLISSRNESAPPPPILQVKFDSTP